MSKFLKLETNILDYSTWATGQTSDVGQFDAQEVNNTSSRISATSPYGNTDVVWKTTATSSPSYGGWQQYRTLGNHISFDYTKTYRFTCWAIRLANGGATDKCHFGVGVYTSGGSTVTPIDVTSTGLTGNYFQQTNGTTDLNTNFAIGEWRLMVGYLRPNGWTGTTDNTNTGIWKPDGTKLTVTGTAGSGDLKCNGTTGAYIGQLVYGPYGGDINSSWEFYQPRIDLVDGTEPSLDSLLDIDGSWRAINTIKIKLDTNILDYSFWEYGVTGDTGNWTVSNFSDSVAYIDNVTDPFGDSADVYAKYGVNTSSRQTLYSPYITLDPTKSYRCSMWLRRPTSGTAVSRLYWSGHQGASLTRLDNDTDYALPYFIGTTNSNLYVDTDWRLFIGYIRPYTWSGTTNDGGVYTTNGTLTGSTISDYKFTGATENSTRWYLSAPYNSEARFEVLYPRIDLVDGTEPSFNTLLDNEGPWRTVTGVKVNISDTWKTI